MATVVISVLNDEIILDSSNSFIEYVFSEDVTGFETGDTTVTGATTLSLFDLSANNYLQQLQVSDTPGTISVSIPADAVTPNLDAPASYTFSYDADGNVTEITTPTVAIAYDVAKAVSSVATGVTFTWSSTTTAFTASDVSVVNGTLSNFAGSGTTYTADLTPHSGTGTLTTTVAADAVLDSVEVSATLEYAPFTTTITVPTQAVGLMFDATVEYSHAVSGVVASDFRLRRSDGVFTNLDSANTTITQTPNTNEYTLAVTLTGTPDDTFRIRQIANTVSYDGSNYPAVSFTSPSFTIDYTLRDPVTVTISTTDTDIRPNEVVPITIVFGETVTDLTASDFTVTGGTRGALMGSGDTYSLSVTAGTAGTLTVALPAGSVTPANALTSQDFTIIAFSITPAGPFTITVGTMNYAQPITVVGSTANTDVTLEGDWEGFYMDWDQPNGTLYIRAAEVTRLVGEYVWLVTATEGMTTVTEDIVYSVVPAAPIIVNPGNLVFYQGASNPDPDIMDGNYKFVEILNEPATALVKGDLLGMKATLGQNLYDAEQMGVFIEGDVPTGAVFTDGPFTCDIFASNDGGEVTLANVPVFITGPNPPANLAFTSDALGLHATWDASTIGLPILDYRIKLIDSEMNETTATATGTSHDFTNVENGMAYTVELESRNATGYSPIVSAGITHEFVDRASVDITFPSQTLGLNNSGTIVVTLTFDRQVVLALNNISIIGGGTLSNFQNVNGRVYRVTATAPASGVGDFSVRMVQDAISTGNLSASSDNIFYAPAGEDAVISVSSVGNDSISNGVVQVHVSFINIATGFSIFVDRLVSGFTIGDIMVTNADPGFDTSIWSLSSVYEVTNLRLEGGTTGSATVTIPADVMTPGNNAVSFRVDWGPQY